MRFRIDIGTLFISVTLIGKAFCAIIVLRSMPLDAGVVGVDKQAIFPALWPSRKVEPNGWKRLSAYVKGAVSFSNPARSMVV